MRLLFATKLLQDRDFTPYALYVLAARVRQAGHEVDIVDALSASAVRAKVRAWRPDVVAFSLVTARWPFFRQLAAALKSEFGVTTIAGGVHASVRPQIVTEPGIDAACVGEGDDALPEFLDRLAAGAAFDDVANLAVKDKSAEGGYRVNPVRPLIRDFASLPMPHFALTDGYRYSREFPVRSMVFSRGCKFRCAFCCNASYRRIYREESRYYRRYTVDRMIEELREATARYPVQFYHFFDDLFVADRDDAIRFAERYEKEIGLPFYCHMAVGMVEPETVRALKRAGLRVVGISLETGDEQMLSSVLKRHYRVDDFVNTIRILNDAGVRSYVGNILALPGSTLETDLATLEVNRRARVGFADSSLFIPLPGTPLGDMARAKGMFDAETFDNGYHSTDPTIRGQVMVDVPHAEMARRLHCLFDLAAGNDWVYRHIRWLIRLPLFPLYLLLFKVHNLTHKRRYFYGDVRFGLRLAVSVAYRTLLG